MFYVHGNCTGDADKACKTMVKLVLRQKAVVTLAKKFHSVEIDASKLDASLGKRYKLVVSPSVVFTDYKGKVLTALPGKQTPERLVAVMKGVVAENTKRVKRAEEAEARKKARSKKS
jgi:thioredoxin-related protein